LTWGLVFLKRIFVSIFIKSYLFLTLFLQYHWLAWLALAVFAGLMEWFVKCSALFFWRVCEYLMSFFICLVGFSSDAMWTWSLCVVFKLLIHSLYLCSHWWCASVYSFSLLSNVKSCVFLLIDLFLHYWKWGIEGPSWCCWITYFSVAFCLLLLLVFWGFAVRFIIYL
jgi:hypothetical protein